ncbi:inhibin beta C chain-like [Bufo gargarizans]|uniref:inhibin beta C chain-like n=1 Tax=Bufo gargarizans TaxID=30331 RepID=UPI001CF27F16|nr:inhibin beta C chain-like [Bufo gargarizans]XP_044143147.1 inhibin beta C chain-like [Bufo gargarizans]
MTVHAGLPLLLVIILVSLASFSCSSCSVFNQPIQVEAEKEILMEVAKQDILNKLHLRQRPNISQAVSRENLAQALLRLNIVLDEDYLVDLPIKNGRGEKELHIGQTHEVISFAEIDNSNGARSVLHFHLSTDKDKQEEIHQAHMWLYLKTTSRNKITLSVSCKFMPKGCSIKGTTQAKAVSGGWYMVPLQMFSGEALNEGTENMYIELMCLDCKNPLKMDNISHVLRPFLALKVHNKQEDTRIRRHITECTNDVQICCLKKFYIAFKDIGWNDWIISPKGYFMNLCGGRCPVHLARAPGIAASSHTAIFSLIKANNVYSNLSLCCVPTKRRPLSFLYFNINNTIVKADIPDMIVDSCGCT